DDADSPLRQRTFLGAGILSLHRAKPSDRPARPISQRPRGTETLSSMRGPLLASVLRASDSGVCRRYSFLPLSLLHLPPCAPYAQPPRVVLCVLEPLRVK